MENTSLIGGGNTQNSIAPSEKSLEDLLDNCPVNKTIANNLIIAWSKINSTKYENIVCSLSGGSDSDIVLDICNKVDQRNNIRYIWFDTGLEYQATKDHLKYLQDTYNIQIYPYKAEKSIPSCCATYGQPFLSKQISEFMSRLQKHNFQWEDESYAYLIDKYPKCSAALKWWCNEWGENSRFNISYKKYLKEFILNNHPQFKISNKCCYYAKKLVAKHAKEQLGCDLSIVGIRRSEGGARASAYKNCFTGNEGTTDEYRPIFWYNDTDKKEYEDYFSVKHSRCYSEYGLKRTGCAGCPFGRNFEYELSVIQKFEPKLYKAVNNIFGDSYEYTRKYKQFCEMMDEKEKE